MATMPPSAITHANAVTTTGPLLGHIERAHHRTSNLRHGV
jgi:hypothetical protein